MTPALGMATALAFGESEKSNYRNGLEEEANRQSRITERSRHMACGKELRGICTLRRGFNQQQIPRRPGAALRAPELLGMTALLFSGSN